MLLSGKVSCKIKESMSNARKIFRFLGFLGEIKKIQMTLKGKKKTVFKLILILMYGSSFCYYIFDNILWGINIGNLR